VPLGQRVQQRLLVREVLVQRADRVAGALGDAVGGRGHALALENLSSGLQEGLHRQA
jgi:stress-induced morphogen